MLGKKEKRIRRHKRVTGKIKGTSKVPRLCVFKSNQYIYAQLIDDEKGKVILQISSIGLKKTAKNKKDNENLKAKTLAAFEVGKNIAKGAIEKKIEKIVFDRGGYKYHGKVKTLADGAREGGLKF